MAKLWINREKKVQNIEKTLKNCQKYRKTGKTAKKKVKNHQKYRKNG